MGIFFQLLQARATPMLAELGLEGPDKYAYLSSDQEKAPGVDDHECFQELCEALAALGFSTEQRDELFKFTAAVLTLGNCDFPEDGDEAKLKDPAPLKKVADLLGGDVAK